MCTYILHMLVLRSYEHHNDNSMSRVTWLRNFKQLFLKMNIIRQIYFVKKSTILDKSIPSRISNEIKILPVWKSPSNLW